MSDDDSEPLEDIVDDIDEDPSEETTDRYRGPPQDPDSRPLSPDDAESRADPDEYTTTDVGESGSGDPSDRSDEQVGRSGPLGDLAADVGERGPRTDQADSELFDEEEVADIDPETVWEQIETDEPEAPPPVEEEERTERVIDSGTYCERCEYFSKPSEVHCSHEGTEILEVVDIDHFRVVNCPIVRENERLEDL